MPAAPDFPPPPDLTPLRRALLSASDKTGLVEAAAALRALGVELVSTGGTRAALEAAGLHAAPYVSDGLEALLSNEKSLGPSHAWPVAGAYFNYRKASIYAGSNEIQHNIMAKAILGL